MLPRPAVSGAAATLVATLISIYIVSQFLRNSIGVIAPDLAAELGLSAAEIGLLSSVFFLSFSAAQIPLGMALDQFGPRRCLLVGTAITVLAAILFALAASPGLLILGRALLGIGVAGALVAPLAVYATAFPPRRFATLTGLQVGIGTTGTLLATAPLAWASATIGWRSSFLAVAGFTLAIGVLIAAVVRHAGHPTHGRRESLKESTAGIAAVLRTPSVGRLFAMNLVVYSSFALIVGLWGGPYLTHVYGFSLEERGNFLLIPVLAQIAGLILWGLTDRLAGSYRLPVLAGSVATAAALGYLALVGTLPPAALAAWFAGFGFISAYTPVLLAHGNALFAPHQVGRGLTILNMGSMGGVFVVQAISGFLIGQFPITHDGGYALSAYRLVFGLQAGLILLACLVYFGSRDPLRACPGGPLGSGGPAAGSGR
ncbi:MAG TPA: MFS transporter [Xanthobacteraceae bacterium]|jgi:predicted MFS family arabinose efflux permease